MVFSGDISPCDNVKHTVEGNVQHYSSLPLSPCVSLQCGAGTVIEKKEHLTDSSDSLEVFVLFPLAKQKESIR